MILYILVVSVSINQYANIITIGDGIFDKLSNV